MYRLLFLTIAITVVFGDVAPSNGTSSTILSVNGDSPAPGGVEKSRAKRVFRGRYIPIEEAPWAGAITHDTFTSTRRCGASIIRPNVALTAAHCVCVPSSGNGQSAPKFSSVQLTVGHSNLWMGQNYEIKDIICYPTYTLLPVTGMPINDVALLRLDGSQTFPAHLTPTCLVSVSVPPYYVGQVLNISGWGRTIPDMPGFSTMLLNTRFRIVSKESCDSKLSNANVDSSLYEQFLCADTIDDSYPTNGDSGGALTANNAQIGLLTSSLFKNDPVTGKPIPVTYVFTKVLNYFTWIYSNSGPFSTCP